MPGEIDSWTAERDGIKYRFDIDPDYDSDRDVRGMDEGMRDETLAAHTRGAWQYVLVTVTPVIDGLDTEHYSPLADSMGGVEWGDLPPTSAEGIPADDCRYGPDDPGVSIGREYIQDTHPGPDMIGEVRANLAKLRDVLASLPLDDCPATHLRTEGISQPREVHCERAIGHAPSYRVMDYEW